jgi:hypothetical protein
MYRCAGGGDELCSMGVIQTAPDYNWPKEGHEDYYWGMD